MEAGGHAMLRINVKTTRSAMFCVAAACFAGSAQADIIGIGVPNAAVSDALLATTQAANLQRSLVTNLSGTAPAAIAPVNSTVTTANNVRLWDEVIPPAPAPKPTQASTTSPGQPRTTFAVAQYPAPSLSSGMQTISLKVNASTVRIGR